MPNTEGCIDRAYTLILRKGVPYPRLALLSTDGAPVFPYGAHPNRGLTHPVPFSVLLTAGSIIRPLYLRRCSELPLDTLSIDNTRNKPVENLKITLDTVISTARLHCK